MNQEYDCAGCGLCCTQYGGELHLYEEDLRRWQEANETQILRRLRVLGQTATAWYSPSDGNSTGSGSDSPPESRMLLKKESACPFLTSDAGYRCAIYPTRPLVCRHFANGGSACRELRAKHGLPVEE